MTIIGINGSPRKKWNTATLLTKAARRKEVFPDDCRKAFDLGCRIASKA